MARRIEKDKIPWQSIGLVAALGFAWSKLGLGAAVKDVGGVRLPIWPTPPPVTQTGYMTQAEWEAAGYGHGSTDYEDWLRGQ